MSEYLRNLITDKKINKVLDVGGRADPMLDIRQDNLTYDLVDIKSEELQKADSEKYSNKFCAGARVPELSLMQSRWICRQEFQTVTESQESSPSIIQRDFDQIIREIGAPVRVPQLRD